ncbi:MAG: molecular chaperone DnaJ [Gaiellaceae bacterium]|jgi:molecular chaperone DnaJ
MARDLYETLGVPRSASADEIKKAYRKLARRHHPDANAGDKKSEERFKEVQNAYDILSDDEKRKQYDMLGAGGPQMGAGAGPGGIRFEQYDLGDLGGLGGFGDVFANLFGGGQVRSQALRGSDVEVPLTLSFEDSLQGAETRVPAEAVVVCSTCAGTGASPGTSPKTCPKCNGRGVVAESQGPFAISQPCSRCRGAGIIIEKPCSTCRGSGRVRKTKRYKVKIPAGVKDGTRIRLKGKGEPGVNGGPAGDLYVVTRVAPSSLYERRGADLIVEVPVTYPEAALGATVEVPTPDGSISLKIPSGSESGKLLRVRGHGAPKLKGSGRGDLLARVRVTVPKKLSKAEKEALEQLKSVSRENPRERLVR